jgi:hypothetical protein
LNKPEPDNDIAGDLAEIIEFKLMGIETVKGKSWQDYAMEILEQYHKNRSGQVIDFKPLWRTLYEGYCSMDKSYSPNIVFMQMIKSFKTRIDTDFPNEEISRDILLDYLDKEIEKAMECD